MDSGPHAHSEPPLPFPLLVVVSNLKRGCSKIRPSALAFHLCSFSEAFSEPDLTSLGSGGAVTSYYRAVGKDGSFVASVLPLGSCSDVLGTYVSAAPFSASWLSLSDR